MKEDRFRRGSQYKMESSDFIIVMRHGERRDGAVGAAPETDPPLTENGIHDISNVAQRLIALIGPHAASQVHLFVSPFLRTRETARYLRQHGIGASEVVDNGLCEVFGPSRIKSQTAPRLSPSVSGVELPVWGESMTSAAARYVTTFYRLVAQHEGHPLLLVTHGDAISAILREFYPLRTVYQAEYLSFVVLKRRAGAEWASGFELVRADGVHWLLDAPEPAEAGRGAPPVEGETCSAAAQTQSQTKPQTYAVPSQLDYTGEVGGEGRKGTVLWRVGGLRALMVVSQLPVLVLWQSKGHAAVYLTVLAVLESVLFLRRLGSFGESGMGAALGLMERVNWGECRTGFVRLGDSRFGVVNYGLLLRQLLATMVKFVVVFLLTSLFSLIGKIFSESSVSTWNCYALSFSSAPGFLVFALFFVVNTLRGYYEVETMDELYSFP